MQTYDFSCAYVGEGLMGSPLAVSSEMSSDTHVHKHAYTGMCTHTYLGVGMSGRPKEQAWWGGLLPKLGLDASHSLSGGVPLSPHHIQGCSHPLQVESAGSFPQSGRGKWRFRAGTLCRMIFIDVTQYFTEVVGGGFCVVWVVSGWVKGTLVLTGNQRGEKGESFGAFTSVHPFTACRPSVCTWHGCGTGRQWEGTGRQEFQATSFKLG